MFQNDNDGECPQCALDRQSVPLQLNREDHWECPVRHLQLLGSGGHVIVLRTRGCGDFKAPLVSATDHPRFGGLNRKGAKDAKKNKGLMDAALSPAG